MIITFESFNNKSDIQINIDLPDDLLNYLIDTMSFIVFKGSKRDAQKHRNYKSLRIKSVSGYYNKNNIQNKEITNNCLIQIEMTNKDKIEAKYINKKYFDKMIENSIYIEINGEPQFYLDKEEFNINYLIYMIATHYKKYIENKGWKIK
ncbi:MAG: hypothetical protein HPY57_15840 [Ignavibacteria bacterium]|nr:hypothetical protein [Ignavibacteria bacterium]